MPSFPHDTLTEMGISTGLEDTLYICSPYLPSRLGLAAGMSLVHPPGLEAAPPWAGWQAGILLVAVALVIYLVYRQARLQAALRQQAIDLARAVQDKQEAEERVQRVSRVYSILSETNQAIVRNSDLHEILNQACQVAVLQGAFDLAWVGLVSPTTQSVRPVASAGKGREMLPDLVVSMASAPNSGCMAEQALRTQQHAVCNHISADGGAVACRLRAQVLGFESIASFPLVVDGKVRGAFNLYSNQPNRFDETELKLLDELALDLSYAMKSLEQEDQHAWAQMETLQISRLFQVLSQVNQQVLRAPTRRDLFDNICQVAVDLGQFRLAWVGWVDEDSQQIITAAHAGQDSDFLRQVSIPLHDPQGQSGPLCTAISAGSAFISVDFSGTMWAEAAQTLGFGAMGSFPIRVAGVVRGTFNVHVKNRDYFRIKEINLLNEVAENISFALDHQQQEALRHQHEVELAEAARRYRAAQQAAHIGSWEWDITADRLTWSDEMFTIFDQDPQTFTPTNQAVFDQMLEIDRPAAEAAVEASLKEGIPFLAEYRIRDRHGALKWVESKGAVLFDPQHRPIRASGTIQDISARKQAELALTHSHDLLRYIIEHDNSSIAVLDRDLRYIYVSQRFLDDYRVAERDVVGRRHYEIFPDLPPAWIQAHQRALAGEVLSAEDDIYQRADGSVDNVRWECRPWYEPGGSIGGIILYTEVITLRKQIEAELRESEQRYRELFLANPHPMWVYDLETMAFLDVNNAAVNHYGYSREEFLAMTLRDIRPPEDIPALEQNVRQHRIDDGYSKPTTWRHRLKDGRIIAVEISSHSLYYAGRPARLVLAVDVTERLAVEEQVRALNQVLEQRVQERTAQLEASNKELEAFAYSVSHDLRAPLRAIDGFSRILLQEYDSRLDDEGKRLLGIIRSNTRKMDHLITDLLALSRVTRSQIHYAPIDMKTLAHSIYHEIAGPEVLAKFTLTVEDLPAAEGDPTLIRQVWTNLISNAVKYTLPKDQGEIHISGSEKDGLCTYAVQDNGVGFNPRYIDKLFGLFQRLHKESDFEGTGVGLAIVQRIVHRHGGQVWAEGQVDQGATFYFTLPQRKLT